jgi:hypothetical protein
MTSPAAAPRIGLIVTGERTVSDFRIFVRTCELWHPDAILYVFTDSATAPALREIRSRLTVYIRIALDAYSGKGRVEMEAMPGAVYATLWTDFMYQKAAVMQWMFDSAPATAAGTATDIWFLDADITLLAPLPAVPAAARVALSPHYIREADCRLYGRYNGGFLMMRDRALLDVWRAAGHRARFYEQSALEDVAVAAAATATTADAVYEFPPQVNFGWWRMYQGSEAPAAIQGKFSLYRADAASSGIRYDGAALQSVHTHWYERTSATGAFNAWFDAYTARFAGGHAPLRTLRRILGFGGAGGR